MRVPRWLWRIVAGVVLVALAVLVTLWLQLTHDKDAADLQICIEVEQAPLAWICRQGLRFHRFSPTEIAEINASAGLWYVAALADETLAKELLGSLRLAGADIDAGSSRVRTRWTALHLAALEPRPQAVRLLLQAGARVDARDADGKTALDLAREAQLRHADRDYLEVMRLLEGAATGR